MKLHEMRRKFSATPTEKAPEPEPMLTLKKLHEEIAKAALEAEDCACQQCGVQLHGNIQLAMQLCQVCSEEVKLLEHESSEAGNRQCECGAFLDSPAERRDGVCSDCYLEDKAPDERKIKLVLDSINAITPEFKAFGEASKAAGRTFAETVLLMKTDQPMLAEMAAADKDFLFMLPRDVQKAIINGEQPRRLTSEEAMAIISKLLKL